MDIAIAIAQFSQVLDQTVVNLTEIPWIFFANIKERQGLMSIHSVRKNEYGIPELSGFVQHDFNCN